MRFLTLTEVLALHRRIISRTGGAPGLRDLGALLGALGQASATFEGTDLYPSLHDKAAALCFSLVSNHPFVDGNKRIGHAVMEVFLFMNGSELEADVDEQELLILRLASGELPREELVAWVGAHLRNRGPV